MGEADSRSGDSQVSPGDRVKAVIKGKEFGGYVVEVEGQPGFLPLRLCDSMDGQVAPFHLGQCLKVVISSLGHPTRGIIVSRASLVSEQQVEAMRRAVLEEGLLEGCRLEGTVKHVWKHGVIVCVGAFDGFVRMADLDWCRVEDAHALVKVGDQIQVQVLGIDLDKGRVRLGVKQARTLSWEVLSSRYPPGTRVKGKVLSILSFGLQIQVERDVIGLLHCNELPKTWRADLRSRFSLGQEIDLEVVQPPDGKATLSLSLEPILWERVNERYSVGQRVQARVVNIVGYGVFVEFDDGVGGLLHNSKLPEARRSPGGVRALRKGENVEVILLSIDESNKRIALTMGEGG